MRYLLLATSVVFLLVAWPARAQDEPETTEGGESEAQAEEAQAQRRVRRLGDVVGAGSDEFDIDFENLDIPNRAAQNVPDVSLPNPQQDQQLQELLRAQAFAPNDPEVEAALTTLLDAVERDIEQALAQGDMARARQLAGVIAEVQPQRGIINEVQAETQRRASVSALVEQAEAALQAGRLTEPADGNAADLFAQVLELDPGNQEATAGLAATHQAVVDEALYLAREELDFEGARVRLTEAEAIHEAPDVLADARQEISDFRQDHIEDLYSQAREHIDADRYDQADDAITGLVSLGEDRARVEALQASLADARTYGSFEPGQAFADQIAALARPGPQMVVMPAGSFMMGSPQNEDERLSNEGPQHRVTFERGFAMARTEITVGQFADFVRSTGYRTDAEIKGSSRIYDTDTGRMVDRNGVDWRADFSGRSANDDLPVLHVSWRDASAYADWLSEQTERNYRLPTEAEFEYALRGGTLTAYWWGNGAPDDNNVENVTGDRDVSPSGARWNVAFRRYTDGYWGPAPAGSLASNPFGLHDMGGNVMEWVEDCWHDSYVRAPEDGSAWINPGCSRRVIRGGSWSSTPAMSRSAFRISSATDSTDMRVGFRVARDL